jgi:hypothetical protein
MARLFFLLPLREKYYGIAEYYGYMNLDCTP